MVIFCSRVNTFGAPNVDFKCIASPIRTQPTTAPLPDSCRAKSYNLIAKRKPTNLYSYKRGKKIVIYKTLNLLYPRTRCIDFGPNKWVDYLRARFSSQSVEFFEYDFTHSSTSENQIKLIPRTYLERISDQGYFIISIIYVDSGGNRDFKIAIDRIDSIDTFSSNIDEFTVTGKSIDISGPIYREFSQAEFTIQ